MKITAKDFWAGVAILISLTNVRGAAQTTISPLDFESILQNPQGTTYGIVGNAIGTDAAGNIYTAGLTQYNSVQATSGALNFSGTYKFPEVFIQKFSPDGSTLLYSAIPAQFPGFFSPVPGEIQPHPFGARVDQQGNVYLALVTDDVFVAGAPTWTGVADGTDLRVMKLGPQGDRILYATRVIPLAESPVAIDLNPDGTVCVGTITGAAVSTLNLALLDPTGTVIGQPYTITDTVSVPYANTLSLAFGPNRLVYAALGPNLVYEADIVDGMTVFQSALGGVSGGQGYVNSSRIVADSSGNSYVAGRAYYSSRSPPFPLTPVDFTEPLTGSWHAFVVKLDPAGNILFADAFSTENLSAIALDANGNVWAAGGTLTGVTILALNSTGTSLQHYISLPVVDGSELTDLNLSNFVYGLAIDGSGRALIAGTTAALVVPDPSSGNHSALNAFFGRLMVNPPTADLKVSVSVSPPVTATTDIVTISITVTNTGGSPAPNVSLKVGEVAPTANVAGQVNYSPRAASCRTTGNGQCGIDGPQLRLSWQSIGSGATVNAEIQEILSGQAFPYSVSVTALTAADNPDQFNANAFATAGLDYSFMQVVPMGPFLQDFQIEVNDLYFRLGNTIGETQGAFPIVANSEVSVYIPSPQMVDGKYVAFQGWVDGVTDNPRIFQVGPPVPNPELIIHPVFVTASGPVLNPDSSAVNAASFKAGSVAPGEVIALFGFNLGPSALTTAQLDATGRIATTLSGFQVLFDGTPAPVIYTSATQSSVVVPYAVEGKSTTNMSIVYNQSSSAVIPIAVSDSLPGLFTLNAGGNGELAAFNQDGSLNSRANPVAPGDIVVFYGSGEGLTNSPVDGALGGSVPPQPTLPVSVTIGGNPAEVIYAGGVTGVTAGVIQLNVRVPQTALAGLLPVVLTVGTQSSQMGGTIAVQ